jgi:bifunctional non-homologous end joining protein LigD
MASDRLRTYKSKRDFTRTPEPKGSPRKSGRKLRYLIQKHDASRLHYDFRLEWDGALMSWAIPKGPSENPDDKRLAVHVEDHPIAYGDFEGTIPEGEYGGGTVMLWDRGFWVPHQEDVDEALKKGKLSFELHGKRLHGNWALVRLRGREKSGKENWLLIKEKDEFVRRSGKLTVDRETTSVKSGREMDEIAQGRKVWHSNKKARGAAKGDPIIINPPTKAKARTAKTSARKRKASGIKKNAALPPFIEPQLATLVDAPPAGGDWLHEIKFDGYRMIAAVAGDRVVIYTRNGLDWTDRFRPVVPALTCLDCDSALLDGEMAVADAEGRTDFGALQDALSGGKGRIAYYLFDILHLNGEDLRKRPLVERKTMLKELIETSAPGGPLAYSDHVLGHGDDVFSNACDLHLEGIISKLADAPYRSGRTRNWLKSKCGMEQEFVIIGWRPSDKAGRPFSSILLAVKEGGRLRYAGRVGTGYTELRLDHLAKEFRKRARKTPPVNDVPPAIARRAHFVEPELVAEIEFRGWTRDGLVRQGAFKGLRADKPASEVVREQPMAKRQAAASAKRTKAKESKTKARGSSKAARSSAAKAVVRSGSDGTEEIDGVRITHPDRVLFAAQEVTKRELIDHYLSIANAMLPHIAKRPISLVRCPRGSGGECFFQKHASEGFPDMFKKVRITEKSGTDQYLYIEDERGLIAAVQMGVLELHLWCCHVDEVEKPDRMIFDLDPDEGLDFVHVREAAKDLRDRLKDFGLESFPMVTGGKGVHVILPLKRGHTWDEHRDFAEAMARVMAEENPDRYVANMSKAKRRGKIFVDYLRNQRGATAICPFSTRARPGAYVAMPVSWPQLARMKDAHPVRVGEAKRFLGGRDPWPGYFKLKQGLPKVRG